MFENVMLEKNFHFYARLVVRELSCQISNVISLQKICYRDIDLPQLMSMLSLNIINFNIVIFLQTKQTIVTSKFKISSKKDNVYPSSSEINKYIYFCTIKTRTRLFCFLFQVPQPIKQTFAIK